MANSAMPYDIVHHIRLWRIKRIRVVSYLLCAGENSKS